MNVGELIDKLGEVPADTPVELLLITVVNPRQHLRAKNTQCDYDRERGIVVLS